MLSKVFIALGFAIVLFMVYLVVKMYTPSWFDTDTFSAKEMPGPAPWIHKPMPVESPHVITPGGPSTPAMKAAPQEEEVAEPPAITPSDPFVEANSSSEIKDNLRHPERMFSPGIQPQSTTSDVMSGVASNVSHVTTQAIQTFVPEMAQNGGEFMKGIAANDTLGDAEYAAF